MYVCVCNAINDRQIKQAIAAGSTSVRELHAHFDLEDCCGRCNACMRNYINQHHASNDTSCHKKAKCQEASRPFAG